MPQEKSNQDKQVKTSDNNQGALTTSDEKVKEVLSKLPEDFPEETRNEIVTLISGSYSGPLPPPEMFGKYEEIHPGSADRIMTMAEKEQNMRDSGNCGFISNDRLRIWGSIIVGFAVPLALVVGAVYCASIGQPVLGGLFGISGIAPIILAAIRALMEKQ